MADNIQSISKDEAIQRADDGSEDWGLEKLLFYIHAARLEHLDTVSNKGLETTTEGQDKIAGFHDLMGRINEIIDKETGKMNVEKGSELEKLLEKAREDGVRISKTTGEFSEREKDRLLENIKHHIEDLNTKVDMELQKITRLTNEKYEMFNLSRMILKGLHEARQSIVRGIKN